MAPQVRNHLVTFSTACAKLSPTLVRLLPKQSRTPCTGKELNGSAEEAGRTSCSIVFMDLCTLPLGINKGILIRILILIKKKNSHMKGSGMNMRKLTSTPSAHFKLFELPSNKLERTHTHVDNTFAAHAWASARVHTNARSLQRSGEGIKRFRVKVGTRFCPGTGLLISHWLRADVTVASGSKFSFMQNGEHDGQSKAVPYRMKGNMFNVKCDLQL